MAIPVLSLISNFYRPRPRYPRGQIHLKLAGISQDIFIRQWGTPELEVTLQDLQRFFSLDFLPLDSHSPEDHPMAAWIYEKVDMFVLFSEGKLIAHFKWSEFKERFRKPEITSDRKRPRFPAATTLSMVA